MDETHASFPPGFLWGTASSAYQTEGGNEWSDWYAEEQKDLPRPEGRRRFAETSGRATDFWNRYEEDLDIARALGVGIHRISIEWGRVMPVPGRPDGEVLKRYRRVLLAMRQRGIEPMVCLHHFTLPAWLAGRGGLLARKETLGAFESYVRLVVETLGDLATRWVTINEPGILASCGYLVGNFPPFRRNYLLFRRALATLLAMHRRASAILRASVPGALVGLAHAYVHLQPWHRSNPFERALAAISSANVNGAVFGGIPRDSIDFLGINYYSTNYVKGFSMRNARDGEPRTDMGWSIHPRGLLDALSVAYRRFRLPVIVTENGIATADDTQRIEYIRNHLAVILEALAQGIDVAGYMYWALTDNFEWAEGYSKRFGLVGIDYATLARTVRDSARWYAATIARNR